MLTAASSGGVVTVPGFVAVVLMSALFTQAACAQGSAQVIDVPTRPGVTQRFLYSAPPDAQAAVILFAGGHGGLQIADNGKLAWGNGNFLVRTSQLFADQGLAVAVIDAPSDRQREPFLGGFRQRPDHTAASRR